MASTILALGILSGCAIDGDHEQTENPGHDQRAWNVSAAQATALLAKDDVVVLDIRTPEEFANGHIPGAININSKAEDRDAQLDALDKSKTYIMH